MTKAFDKIAEGLREALEIARGEAKPARQKGWRPPRHSRFLAWSMVRARLRSPRGKAAGDGAAFFAGPTRRFWPLREQLYFNQGRAQHRRQTGLFYHQLRKMA